MKSFGMVHPLIIQTPKQEMYELIYLGAVYGTIEELFKHCKIYLHYSELQELATYEFELKRHSFLLGRFAAKQALLQYVEKLSLKPCHFLIQNRSDGTPFVYQKNVNLTLSHSHNIGIACVSMPTLQLGIDIEFKTHFDSMDLDHNFFSLEEYGQIFNKSLLPESVIKCILWSAKEALVKYLKVGLSVDFNILSIDTVIMQKNFIEIYFKYFRSLKVITYQVEDLVLSFCINKHVFFTTENHILMEILNEITSA
jgi:phosphopantetheinyl transferase